MQYEITGTIRQVGEVHTIESVNGQFNKREVYVETQEQYPEQMAIELTGEDAVNFNGFPGQNATFFIHFRVSRSASGAMFNRIRCWRVDIHH